MTGTTKALIEYLRKIEVELDEDWLRQMVQSFTQAVIELEAEQAIGAGRYERSPSRLTQRNGYRVRGLATRVGELDLRIPKLRQGSFFPSLLEPRLRVLLTPVDASWLNQAELLLDAFTVRYLLRGDWASPSALIDHILASRCEYNHHFAHPFAWRWSRRDFRFWLNNAPGLRRCRT